jgi:hypothetical protein
LDRQLAVAFIGHEYAHTGDNKNVMCVIDDIFVYLRARANDALGRVRPTKHEDKPEAAKKWTDSCFGKGG